MLMILFLFWLLFIVIIFGDSFLKNSFLTHFGWSYDPSIFLLCFFSFVCCNNSSFHLLCYLHSSNVWFYKNEFEIHRHEILLAPFNQNQWLIVESSSRLHLLFFSFVCYGAFSSPFPSYHEQKKKDHDKKSIFSIANIVLIIVIIIYMYNIYIYIILHHYLFQLFSLIFVHILAAPRSFEWRNSQEETTKKTKHFG